MTSINDQAPGERPPTSPGSHIPESRESFFALLQAQDALGALIRAHFQIEARVQRVLEQHMCRAEELPLLTYQHKVRLAVALGMQSRTMPALLLLGQLRDSAIRSGAAALGDAAVDRLFGVLARPEREAVLGTHREHVRQGGTFRQSAALQRFNIIAAVLHASLAESDATVPSSIDASLAAGANEVVTFEWSAPTPPPAPVRRARDFASQEALYSWLIVSD